MRLKDFDYNLPKELIAQYPLEDRGASRMLVLDRISERIEHISISSLPAYLEAGDCIVLNDTKVIPARLFGRTAAEKTVEFLLLDRISEDSFSCLIRPLAKVKMGEQVYFGNRLKGRVVKIMPEERLIKFDNINGNFIDILNEIGEVPLPPYVKRAVEPLDKKRYQTIYAKAAGAVAAPTAGFHLTQGLLVQLKEKGVNIVYATLHIGYATFSPVRVDDITKHKMHREYFELTQEAASIINKTKKAGRRILAVGTSCARVLEHCSCANDGARTTDDGRRSVVYPQKGYTELFIYPPYQFKMVDMLLTNFHMPRTTLLMLVAAFAHRDSIMRTYEEAIRERYRFLSYGDAMLII